MNTYKKHLSLILAFTIFFTSFQTVVFASDINNDFNFDILEGENENQIIIIENGESFTLETVLEKGYHITNVYDELGNLLSSDRVSLSEFNENGNSSVIEDDLLGGCSFSAILSGGNGTKENPYRYCTPGTANQFTEKLSYAKILGMTTSVVTAVTVTAAIASLLSLPIATFNSTAAKQAVAAAVDVLKSPKGAPWFSAHGISMYIRTECVLQNHVDNAWGENIWFYGKVTKFLRFSTY